MGRREVTIYTCDGCRTSSTMGRDDKPYSYTSVELGPGVVWLCNVCYTAVQWVARYQGILPPPTIYGEGRDAGLRKPPEPDKPAEIKNDHGDVPCCVSPAGTTACIDCPTHEPTEQEQER